MVCLECAILHPIYTTYEKWCSQRAAFTPWFWIKPHHILAGCQSCFYLLTFVSELTFGKIRIYQRLRDSETLYLHKYYQKISNGKTFKYRIYLLQTMSFVCFVLFFLFAICLFVLLDYCLRPLRLCHCFVSMFKQSFEWNVIHFRLPLHILQLATC